MIRDDARAFLQRYAELFLALGVVLLGVGMIRQPGPVVQGIGVAGVALGVGWARVALRRARFQGGGDAPGAVVVDEARITYFAPFDGGIAALDDLAQIDLTPGKDAIWHLQLPGQPHLDIPHGARGADVLIDAFATLPGFRGDRALSALDQPAGRRITVWRRAGGVALTSR